MARTYNKEKIQNWASKTAHLVTVKPCLFYCFREEAQERTAMYFADTYDLRLYITQKKKKRRPCRAVVFNSGWYLALLFKTTFI